VAELDAIKQKIEELEQDLGIDLYDKEADEKPSDDMMETTHDDHNIHTHEEPIKIDFIDHSLTDKEASTDTNDFKTELDSETDLENELDSEWIFNDPSENVKVLKLKSILNKVRLYKMSARKAPSKI
jgi:hypothetical protein